MSHEPRTDVHALSFQNRQLKRQIKLLYAELGWSEETIRRWERGELDAR